MPGSASKQQQHDVDTVHLDPKQRRLAVEACIRRLQALPNQGLWGLALFILLSIGAQQSFDFLPSLPPQWRTVLGPPPPLTLVHIALAVYGFSALTLVLGRMMQGTDTYHGWSHLAYLSAFYAFYWYADALSGNFWAVFTAGLTILTLEYYRIRTHCADAVREQKTLLSALNASPRSPSNR